MLPHELKLREFLLNLLFPKRCIGCGKEGLFLCPSCTSRLPRIMPPVCPLCGRPQASEVVCASCVNWLADIDGIRSPFRFEGVVKQLVYQLKYRNLRAVAPTLAVLISDYLCHYPVPGEVLVPVPVHPKRLRERGYNQSFLLAKELSVLTGLPVNATSLIKLRAGSPQAKTTSVDERRTNVAGAFACVDRSLAKMEIILIDDVSTSGATLNACATALKASGAKSVRGLTFAREI